MDTTKPRYIEVLRKANQLEPEDQLRLLQDLAASIRERLRPKDRSILELEGLGKEVWGGVDAQEYVNQERQSRPD